MYPIKPLFSEFVKWAKKKDQDYLKENSIIQLRNEFYIKNICV